MLDKYSEYIKGLTAEIDHGFNDQREFIACKAGCGICCKSSYYGCSKLEWEYVKIGFEKLDERIRNEINMKSVAIIKDRIKFAETNPNLREFEYTCPFLYNDSCINYEYRPMLCRSHGLIYYDVDKEGKINVPYCMNLGLNYANVWDPERKNFSEEKMQELGIKAKPQPYHLSYTAMLKGGHEKGIDFGEVSMLVEWVVLDIPDYQRFFKK